VQSAKQKCVVQCVETTCPSRYLFTHWKVIWKCFISSTTFL